MQSQQGGPGFVPNGMMPSAGSGPVQGRPTPTLSTTGQKRPHSATLSSYSSGMGGANGASSSGMNLESMDPMQHIQLNQQPQKKQKSEEELLSQVRAALWLSGWQGKAGARREGIRSPISG